MNPDDENFSIQSNEAISGSSHAQPTVQPTKIKYEVKHGLFKWSIENFSSFPSADDKYGLSPIFELKETWWYIAFHSKAKICGQDKISLNLIRHKSDCGPQNVVVSYRLGLESGENKVWFKPEENVIFGRGDSYGFQSSILGHLKDFSSDDKSDIVSVLCEIYTVYVLNANIRSSNSLKLLIDSDLPSNLVNIFRKEQRHDVLIEIPKLRVRAHKSVLSARSKILARMLEDGKSFIQLSCKASCLYCVLYYMYSGSFSFLAKNCVFSIGLYELACELSLLSLRNLLTPYNSELNSRITIDECEFECILHEFRINDKITEETESSDYYDRRTGIGVKIHFQQTNNSDCLEFCVKVSGTVTALDFSFQLYILNKDCEPTEKIPVRFLENSEAVFKNFVFTYTVCFTVSDVLKCCSSDGNLYLKFACKRYSLIHLSEISLNVNKELLVWCDNDWLEELSSDLKMLFRTGYLSDVTLVASGHPFKVHRSILGARSTYFHRLFFYDRYKNDVLSMSGVECHILELMLTFIYSGILEGTFDFTKADALELYKVAEEYEIKPLKNKCVKYMSLNLDPWFVFEVLAAAEECEDSHLITICMDYLKGQEWPKQERVDLSEKSEEL